MSTTPHPTNRRTPSWWGTFVLLCLLAVFGTGCINNKAFWQKKMAAKANGPPVIGGEWQSSGIRPPVVLGEHEITNAVAGTVTNGSVRVSYEEGMEPHAGTVAVAAQQALVDAEQALGMSFVLRPHVYLLSMPGEQRVIQFSMPIRQPEEVLPWLMVVTNSSPARAAESPSDDQSIWAGLHPLGFHLFVMVHELCEISLVHPGELLVMPDVQAKKGFIRYDFKYRTRWFRDGLANYAGYKASESFRRKLIPEQIAAGPLKFLQGTMRPFTALAKAKDSMFRWAQSSEEDYYAASTALFLVLEQRKGADCIPEIVQALRQVEFPNGKALERLIRERTGVDLREFARNFYFPNLGFESRTHATGRQEIQEVEPDGWADRAGLKLGDLLVAVNGIHVSGMTEFELEIFKTMESKKTVALTLMRDGQMLSTTPRDLPSRGVDRRVQGAKKQAAGNKKGGDVQCPPAQM